MPRFKKNFDNVVFSVNMNAASLKQKKWVMFLEVNSKYVAWEIVVGCRKVVRVILM